MLGRDSEELQIISGTDFADVSRYEKELILSRCVFVCMHVCNQGLYVYIKVSIYMQKVSVCRYPRRGRVWMFE